MNTGLSTILIEPVVYLALNTMDGQWFASAELSYVAGEYISLEPGESVAMVPYESTMLINSTGHYPCDEEVYGVVTVQGVIVDVVYEKLVETDVAGFTCLY